MIHQRIEGITMAEFAAGYTHANKMEVLLLFDSTPGEESEIKTKSGIILLGREAMPAYEKKPTSNDQKTIFARIVPNPWYEFEGDDGPDGKPVRYQIDVQEGDIAELYGPAFADLKFSDKVWAVDDGVVALCPCNRIACMHRDGKVLPFGPYIIAEPVEEKPANGIYLTMAKYVHGKAVFVAGGSDPDGEIEGVVPGDVIVFNHAKAIPYTIRMDDGRVYWQIRISHLLGVES